MHEILSNVSASDFVLDLGSAQGSFDEKATSGKAIRLDREVSDSARGALVVRADAALLPFGDDVFRAVISNHSLEHFDNLERAIVEMGRVVDPNGALYVSVPDASTITDQFYRWLARGGGHVNAFVSPGELIRRIETVTGMRHVATRTLCSSMAFLNRNTATTRRPRRLLFFGGGAEWSLRMYTWFSRRFDLVFRTRLSVYGWAFYFGNIPGPISTSTRLNVCIRCGSATAAETLRALGLVSYRMGMFECFRCPACATVNPFIADRDMG